jgi:hypothetical protein
MAKRENRRMLAPKQQRRGKEHACGTVFSSPLMSLLYTDFH